MAASMVDIAIVKSICSYVSRFYKAYRSGREPRVNKTIFPIPEDVKEVLKNVVIECKDQDIFEEIAGLVQHKDRTQILEYSHMEGFKDLEEDFSPLKFLKIAAVCILVAAELEMRGFSKAVEIAERDISLVYMQHRGHDAFKTLGFHVKNQF